MSYARAEGTSAVDDTVILLPGIIAPAEVRYGALIEHLRPVSTLTQELAVYDGDAPPEGYSMSVELDSLDRAADDAGLDRFHLFGHSAGGAVGLAYAAERGDRLLSLAVDEPASDFTAEGDAVYGWSEFDEALALPAHARMLAFMRLQVAADVELPPPPDEPPPAWMATRPAGVEAFSRALRNHRIDTERYRGFRTPVYFSRGSRTHPRWEAMQERLAAALPDFTAEVFEGLHHLNPAHHSDPARAAATLVTFWERAESRR